MSRFAAGPLTPHVPGAHRLARGRRIAAALWALCVLLAAAPARAAPVHSVPARSGTGAPRAVATTRAAPAPPARRRELGLRLGGAYPICTDQDCVPHVGEGVRLHALLPTLGRTAVGFSVGYARFSYVDTLTGQRHPAMTTSLRLLMRLYPVLGRRGALFFECGLGAAISDQHGYTGGGPTFGVGLGVPITVASWLRLGPYAAGLFHFAGPGDCSGNETSSGGPCGRPAHTGYFSFGLETTAQY